MRAMHIAPPDAEGFVKVSMPGRLDYALLLELQPGDILVQLMELDPRRSVVTVRRIVGWSQALDVAREFMTAGTAVNRRPVAPDLTTRSRVSREILNWLSAMR